MYAFLGAAIVLGMWNTIAGLDPQPSVGSTTTARASRSGTARSSPSSRSRELMAEAPMGFQLHALVAFGLFALWPFTRLVHVFSAPVGYLTRPYIVYRSRDDDQLGSHAPGAAGTGSADPSLVSGGSASFGSPVDERRTPGAVGTWRTCRPLSARRPSRALRGARGDVVEPLRRYLARRTDPDTADDVLADTLLVCWRRVDDVPDPALPWAYGVARKCLDNAVRGQRRRERLAAKVAAVDLPAPTPGRRGARPARRGRPGGARPDASGRGRAAAPVGVGAARAGRDRGGARAEPQRRVGPAPPGARTAARRAR